MNGCGVLPLISTARLHPVWAPPPLTGAGCAAVHVTAVPGAYTALSHVIGAVTAVMAAIALSRLRPAFRALRGRHHS